MDGTGQERKQDHKLSTCPGVNQGQEEPPSWEILRVHPRQTYDIQCE